MKADAPKESLAAAALVADARAPVDDPQWYRDAVIYELHIKAYADSNGDGIGDFRGLTERLDHVQALGVNTIWLLPFYPSPLRDDGYDVADYRNVHPSYGTLEDFRAFLAESHRRGLRVITELVVNHTSDQHPWFQAARRAPKGSPERAFYVWSDSPDRYAGTRIIFTDTEKSNWTWDDVAGQYYWHRFFSHQPDLNFDNPAVLEAVLQIMEFWLEMGVDGFRLDAIPYLVERDGTSNENLRETHEVIKQIRRRIDARFPGRLLLAEANMWPEDVREYFGDDDECHMAYHFPLMPRMYMAIAQEDRHPVVEILAQTPDIPARCQWAIFLRNHDELTLEMVTSQERDYMYSMYAADARSRINLGIRRRLAPLLENDMDRIKLMNSLLLSMPGTPVLYYGDEIGMGDNIFLGDRDGVRTPMQWTGDRNGGFSRADPQRLYLPPIQDAVYGFEAVNVEAQSREPSSLLAWTRRLLAVRASSQAFGRGRFTMLHPGNRKVLAYVREQGDDAILCVANVSRRAQPVELDLSPWKGRVPVELMGHTAFPPIGELPYLLTLPGHDFFWFRLSTDAEPPRWHAEQLAVDDLPVLVLFDGWNSFFRQRVVPWRIALAEKTRAQLERQTLPRFVQRQRWYASKSAPPQRAALAEYAMLESARQQWLLGLVDVHAEGEAPVRYCLPLAIAFEADDERMRALAALAACKVRQQANMGLLGDAMGDEAFCRALVQFIARGQTLRNETGALRGVPGPGLRQRGADLLREAQPLRRLTLSSNSVTLLGDSLFLKLYRRVQPGINVEVEMGHHLTDVLHFDAAVPVLGSLEWTGADGTACTLALLQACVTHQGDAWGYFVDQIALMLEASEAGSATGEPVPADPVAAMAQRVQVLAARVADLHVALARRTGDPAFDPTPVTAEDLRRWAGAVKIELDHSLSRLRRQAEAEPQPLAEVVLGARERLVAAIERAAGSAPLGLKTRIHGDLHLQQVLLVRDDFLLIDFEGEPGRTMAERRERHSALRDLAGMLRSLDYARESALQTARRTGGRQELLAEQARRCERRLRQAFIERYREGVVAGGLYRSDEFEPALALLDLFEIEKALYELRYELDNRPDWLSVPLAGLAALAGQHV